jgi:hypothetical protein
VLSRDKRALQGVDLHGTHRTQRHTRTLASPVGRTLQYHAVLFHLLPGASRLLPKKPAVISVRIRERLGHLRPSLHIRLYLVYHIGPDICRLPNGDSRIGPGEMAYNTFGKHHFLRIYDKRRVPTFDASLQDVADYAWHVPQTTKQSRTVTSTRMLPYSACHSYNTTGGTSTQSW